MTALREQAKAKLNLSLRVLGRRPDGFHAIESLAVFASVGDELDLDPGAAFSLTVEGPFASALAGPNLIEAAAEAARACVPALKLGGFRLRKTLPVAAGLGGGAADAAAALRLLARANPGLLDAATLEGLAGGLGSDVTACLRSTPQLMRGRGEIVTPVEGLPACGVVLANPGVPLATAKVYATLGARKLGPSGGEAPPPDFGGSFEALIAYASARGNDLEPPALKLAPIIGDVLDALSGLGGARLVSLSGSGPTCFALFASPYEAKRAAASLASARPAWWVAASTIEGSGEAAA